MHAITKILVWISNDTNRDAVVSQGAALAKRYQAALTLVNVVEELPWYTRLLLPSAEALQGLLLESRLKALETMADSLRREGVEVTSRVLRGRGALEVVREVFTAEHDLVLKVADAKAGGGFSSVDLHLLRDCPCPVWMVHPEHANKPVAKILAAVDPAIAPAETDVLNLEIKRPPEANRLDEKILDLATSLTAAEGCRLHVVHAWSVPGEALLTGETMLSREDILGYAESIRTADEDALERLLNTYPAIDRQRVHVFKGYAPDVITDVAESQHVDLIVMGTIARTGIPGFLMGNTAETVFQRVGCSVLAVKPDGFVSAVSPA